MLIVYQVSMMWWTISAAWQQGLYSSL